jgi:hypothetical protein
MYHGGFGAFGDLVAFNHFQGYTLLYDIVRVDSICINYLEDHLHGICFDEKS